MNKLKLTIDTESINMENEIHINNFSQKIKNLARHCVNFVNGIEDNTDCSNSRYLPEFHDSNDETTFDSFAIPSFGKKKINRNFILYDTGFSNLLHI